MPNRPPDRGQRDRSRISMIEDRERRYWAKELGVTEERLLRAIQKVGAAVQDVREELKSASATEEANRRQRAPHL